MKFPGRRKTKHYFPVKEETRTSFDSESALAGDGQIIGIDQLLVDIEVKATDELLLEFDIPKGESSVFPDDVVERLYRKIKSEDLVLGEYAGGAIGNTLHNFSILSDTRSIALGTICEDIKVGDYAFKYITNTSSKVDFNYLMPSKGHLGRAICFITPDGERSFVIGKGIMNELHENFIPDEVIKNSSALLISAFLLRDEASPMFTATLKAARLAKEFNIPVVFSLSTSSLIEEKKEFFLDFVTNYVSVIAGNLNELGNLVEEKEDALLAGEKALDLADMVLLTVGKSGLYICAHVDESEKRKTKDMIHSKSIAEYNKYEYSRAMKKRDCENPKKIYSHINPFLGGPLIIKNTNGAGDGALAAVLHDMAANNYHRSKVPNSPKHQGAYLTYSSIHQVCKYSNRVSYEVLSQNSPRLARSLPEKEECLEDSYWSN